MSFAPIRYLEWARAAARRPVAFDLSSSAVESPRDEDLDLSHFRATLGGGDLAGHPRLRELIGRAHGMSPGRVMPAIGTSHANFLAAAALARPGERVACEWPAYEPLWRVLESAGARVEFVRRDLRLGYAPDPAEVCSAFARGARLLFLSDLHNPTGALLERSLLRELAALAERFDAWLVVDEVYLPGVFDRPVESAATLSERVVVTGSLTKIFGLGNLRAGWLVGPPEVLRRAREVNDHLAGHASHVGEAAAAHAFERLDGLRSRAAARRAVNWPAVQEFALQSGAELFPAAGGFVAWMRLPDCRDADGFAADLLARHDTRVVPGTFFGVRDHVRLGYGGPPDRLREGLARIARALAGG